jgi:glycosyltransferase involved in cell wall biosynthesis
MRYPVYSLNGLICPEKELPLTGKGIRQVVTSLYERGRSNFVYKKVLDTIQREQLDVSDVVIYSYWFTDQAITAWRLKKHLVSLGNKAKAVCRAHRYDLYWDKNPAGFLPYQEETLRNLDGVYACSDDGRDYLQEMYPHQAHKAHTGRLGTTDYGVIPCDAQQKTFVTCCSLKKFKRISLFAEAFCMLSKRDPNCRWVCIGDGEELEEIKRIIHLHGVENRVDMIGRLKNLDVIAYYKSNPLSYFCNVSTSEGIPVSIMEALSFGIPVIATDVGGSRELITEENGHLLPEDINAETLAAAMEQELSLSEAQYAQKRSAARQTWEEKSSAQKNYTAWCQLLLD